MENLQIIENQGQRVLTTSQIAEAYGTDVRIVSNNFNRNSERYVEGKHFYCLKGEELKEFKAIHQNDENLKFMPVLYLWTEKGALLHAKSLNTDKAWEVYDKLVETYFKVVNAPATMFEELSPQLQLLINIETRQNEQQDKINELDKRVYDMSVAVKDLTNNKVYENLQLEDKTYPIGEIANEYGKDARWLNRYLCEKKIQYKRKGHWKLRKAYEKKQLTVKRCLWMAWTQKGKIFIQDLLKKDNILPLVEIAQN